MSAIGKYWLHLVRGQTAGQRPRLRSSLHMVLAIAAWLGLGLTTVAVVAAMSSTRPQQAALHTSQLLR